MSKALSGDLLISWLVGLDSCRGKSLVECTDLLISYPLSCLQSNWLNTLNTSSRAEPTGVAWDPVVDPETIREIRHILNELQFDSLCCTLNTTGRDKNTRPNETRNPTVDPSFFHRINTCPELDLRRRHGIARWIRYCHRP